MYFSPKGIIPATLSYLGTKILAMAEPYKVVFNLPEVSLAPERRGGTVQGSQDETEGIYGEAEDDHWKSTAKCLTEGR